MSRLQSVDVLRAIAILAVIVIHTSPFETAAVPIGSALDAATICNQGARFAVPFFFVISGYFWAVKFADDRDVVAPTLKMAKRVAFIFLAWSLIYLLPLNIVDAFGYGAIGPIKALWWNLLKAVQNPLTTLLAGTKPHLWFLTALLYSLIIAAVFIRRGLIAPLIGLAAVLFAVGLAGKAYADTPIGFHLPFDFRNGPFFALALFVTGYLLQRAGRQDWWLPLGILFAVGGGVLHFAEVSTIHRYWGTTMEQDYVVGTYFFGLGVALIALSDIRYLRFQRLAAIGPLILGVYTVHYAFVELLRPADQALGGNPLWDLPHILVVFVLAYLATRVLARSPLTRRLVG